MNEIIEKTRKLLPPLLLGWLLTIWFPVPALVRQTLNTAVSAAMNGVRAAMGTVQTARIDGKEKNG